MENLFIYFFILFFLIQQVVEAVYISIRPQHILFIVVKRILCIELKQNKEVLLPGYRLCMCTCHAMEKNFVVQSLWLDVEEERLNLQLKSRKCAHETMELLEDFNIV